MCENDMTVESPYTGRMEAAETVPDQHDGDVETASARRRKLRLIGAVIGLTFVFDSLVIKFVMPWADENYITPYGSLGYVIAFLLAFLNVIVAIVLVTFFFQGASYPSDRWQ